jgi:hypothetical protein
MTLKTKKHVVTRNSGDADPGQSGRQEVVAVEIASVGIEKCEPIVAFDTYKAVKRKASG